jgi:hypothetical protein
MSPTNVCATLQTACLEQLNKASSELQATLLVLEQIKAEIESGNIPQKDRLSRIAVSACRLHDLARGEDVNLPKF